jgi:hypothetical protein
MIALGRWYLWFCTIGWFLGHRHTRYVLAWLLAAAGATHMTYTSWHYFDQALRLDGNDGHTSIDFASQWIMGRMLAVGEGHNLYERGKLREVAHDAFPRDLEGTAKKDKPGDAEDLLGHLRGTDTPNAAGRKVGGALYPPINAFLHWPVGLFDPQIGYRIHQLAQVVLVLVCALAVRVLSRGRIWVPVAALLILYSADFFGNQILGQNAVISLAVVLWGWVLVSRDQDVLGGAVLGLLAYKPVWAMSYFFVLLLTRRWRGCLAMLACGALQGLLTLPLVGMHSWLEWKEIGAEVAYGNRVWHNWIHLSRTIQSIPRRYLVDFDLPEAERDALAIDIVCWALYLLVIELSVRLIVMRGRDARAVAGPGAAFVLSAAWLCCFQHMYYDAMLSFPAIIVLLLDPRSLLRPRYLARDFARWQHLRLGRWTLLRTTPRQDGVACATGDAAVLTLPGAATYGWIKNPVVLLPIVMIYTLQNWLIPAGHVSDNDPFTILSVMALWLYCGWLWTCQAEPAPAERAAQPATGSDSRITVLTTEAENGQATRTRDSISLRL